MTRSFLRAVTRGLAGVILTAQMAISSYACPALMASTASNMPSPPTSVSPDEHIGAAADAPMAQMNNCDDMNGSMDRSSPNLCAEHCKYGQQSDQVSTLNAPTVALIALYVTPPVPEMALPPHHVADTMSALVAASPPHAILHCVYRI